MLCVTGEEEVEVGGEEAIDEKALTKRDIHTLNEQRRRDVIKVWYCSLVMYIENSLMAPSSLLPPSPRTERLC